MSLNRIKPNHRALGRYYGALDALAQQGVFNELSIRAAFHNLLAETAPKGWVLVAEQPSKLFRKTVYPDGTFRDGNSLPRGYWEAKDTADDLDAEIARKIALGYPLNNMIFEDSRTAVLYQSDKEVLRVALRDPAAAADLLNAFYAFAEPDIEGFERAVDEFKIRIPELAEGLMTKIEEAHGSNRTFISAYEAFLELCRTSLNPNISRAAVDEMIAQHLLTERLFRTVFSNEDFTRRNVIAAEVEKVIDALVSQSFNRAEFLKSLDRFYQAIEGAARTLEDFSDKQHFLNSVYEQFFQGFSVKVADTHGIVYTPQPIVDFMCASVAKVLERDFGKSLGASGVVILDPATGTGNFIVNLLRRMAGPDLHRAYKEQLFANEIMLLPYYIAALNIEHAYYELTERYEPFEGLAFVDTLDLARQNRTMSMFTEANAARVKREQDAPVTVLIANPPYNVGQVNENDNNKNRKYPAIDGRIKETYAKASRATLNTKLYDPYVKFFRWAADRLEGRDGIVCYVSNNSFIDQVAFDGMRKHFADDFTRVYHLDLGGNVRKNPKRSGTKHNVFGIQVGVGITIAVRLASDNGFQLRYASVPGAWTRDEKLQWLSDKESLDEIEWSVFEPTKDHNWLPVEGGDQWDSFLPMGTQDTKRASNDTESNIAAIFKTYSLGVSTNRDDTVYDFQPQKLLLKVDRFASGYMAEVDRYKREKPTDGELDDFLDYSVVKWSRNLKRDLRNGRGFVNDPVKVRRSLYRPFTSKHLYLADIAVDEAGQTERIFPNQQSEQENVAICAPTIGFRAGYVALAVASVPNLNLTSVDGFQCFPLFVYSSGESRQNVTDWALAAFRTRYADPSIAQRDVFHYVYAMLHHPSYCTDFAGLLKRSLPRIPFAPDFWPFAKAGARLAELHVGYEALQPFKLQMIQERKVPFSWLVRDRMKLSPDRTSLVVNPSLTLAGIPPEAFDYRLGNRSALEWVIDQYQVKRDKVTGSVTSDPNRGDDEEYIVRLVGQVIALSMETVSVVAALPVAYKP